MDDNELTVDVLECRLERMVGRQSRKLGLFECVVVERVVEDDEYCEFVRWRPPEEIIREDDETDDDDEVDSAGDSRRAG